ncbi:hypothetical protein DUZ99_15300 [Xylanibacillus composti]|uniref:Tagaturonate/fructuronate epimerase n=1 Tax=Xylanibacillus composti TaxID=1572762 RepID=A0A8J4H469_9BACL|nr:tagaturonate epimerase family protein [Xylanibacillus composti]MDT9726348.1 hypothetical protein [Xylanibacillus composti]GIQ70544.1 hypothetical protein XYCOK13_33680 [Xylanibacillus composti]
MAAALKQIAASSGWKVYDKSLDAHGGTALAMVRGKEGKFLLAVGEGELFEELDGTVIAEGEAKAAPLTHDNRKVLNRYFPYTAPRALGTEIATIGLGDRLGIAGPGQLQAVKGKKIWPVLAQQSIRELHLTGRSYEEVLDAACYAVFQEGFRDGFGADGDHLKAEADIELALRLGFTMLTLDCSEHIDNDVASMDGGQIRQAYETYPSAIRERYEQRYSGKTFAIGEESIAFDAGTLQGYVCIYSKAIDFMERIYNTYIVPAGREIDFEISIDETLTPTDPAAHFMVAQELRERGVHIYSMAPRFCGEFQKGIDYIGDLGQFEQELKVHAAIADHFGYKLSIHSGSDKFSVFPIIGKHTSGRFHVKTAGTNWLEAVRTVAQVNPTLYRRMHAYALEHVEEALAYYHVSMKLEEIAPLDRTPDEQLPAYIEEDNARQLIHITYGLLLQAQDEQGKSLFKTEFYETLDRQEEAYAEALRGHIGRHLELLGKS